MFNEIIVKPIINLLFVFYKLFSLTGISGALGWSIIALTLFIRSLLNPLTKVQMQSVKKLAEIKPQIDALSKKHGNDKKRLQQEQLKLYQQAGVNPAAGCLPALVQIPVFIGLYNVFLKILAQTEPAEIIKVINEQIYSFFSFLKIETLNLGFFGLDLSVRPNQWQSVGIGLLLIPVITAGLQWIQTKVTMVAQPKQAPENGKEGDFSKALQMQTGFFLPLMIGFFSYSFPIGLALYWNTFSLFGIIQQIKFNKK